LKSPVATDTTDYSPYRGIPTQATNYCLVLRSLHLSLQGHLNKVQKRGKHSLYADKFTRLFYLPIQLVQANIIMVDSDFSQTPINEQSDANSSALCFYKVSHFSVYLTVQLVVIHFASVIVAVNCSQLMASSSALWKLNKPPSSFVIDTSRQCVCCSLQSQSGDEAIYEFQQDMDLGLCRNDSTVSRNGTACQGQAVG